MKKPTKKLLSVLLITSLLLSVITVSVSAIFNGGDLQATVTVYNEICYTEIEHVSNECDSHSIVLNSSDIVQNAAPGELPEPKEAYAYSCDTCNKQTAYNSLLPQQSDGTYGTCAKSGCDGKYIFYTICAKEYYYEFECGKCGREDDFNELPTGSADAPYGTCISCGAARNENKFWITYRYRQYSRPCFYCFKVQLGTKSVYDSPDCPYCGECYDMVVPESVDSNGNLIYGGGGSKLYYCTQTEKFYQATEDENGTVDNACPYCDNHDPYKINILYCVICPSCGIRAERSHIDYFNRPYLAGTFNNALMSIAVNITGTIDPNDFELTNRCYECGYNFSEDNTLVITRHVDAPNGAVYDTSPNDRDYHETDTYIEEGSEYDNFFERIIWLIRRMFHNIEVYISYFFDSDNW